MNLPIWYLKMRYDIAYVVTRGTRCKTFQKGDIIKRVAGKNGERDVIYAPISKQLAWMNEDDLAGLSICIKEYHQMRDGWIMKTPI
jgi:hypothetical protein